MNQLNHILVPVDGSEGSDRACGFAAHLAAATGAQLTLLHVVELTSAQVMGMRSVPAAEVQHQLRAAAAPTLARMRRSIAERTDEIEPPLIAEEVTVGPPADEILAWAERHQPDLIVMGCRGLSPLRELMLGSVSDKVVRRAPCPVTITR